MLAGGAEGILSGGSVSGTTVFSGPTLNILSGASGSGLAVASGGVLNDGGSVTSQAIAKGGTEHISSGGLATSVTLSAGLLDVLSGGSATIINDAGTVKVEAGGDRSSCCSNDNPYSTAEPCESPSWAQSRRQGVQLTFGPSRARKRSSIGFSAARGSRRLMMYRDAGPTARGAGLPKL
jgi:autotransporter passenger strand-loop-strand repeat protein